MRNYVLGFLIDLSSNEILLIKKNRPAFQAGKLNGIGGKMEEGETPIESLIREVWEETNLKTQEKEWGYFGKMNLPEGGHVFLFKSFRNDLNQAVSMTDEEIVVRKIDLNQLKKEVMPNLIWLIDAAMDKTLNQLDVNLN